MLETFFYEQYQLLHFRQLVEHKKKAFEYSKASFLCLLSIVILFGA